MPARPSSGTDRRRAAGGILRALSLASAEMTRRPEDYRSAQVADIPSIDRLLESLAAAG